MPRAPPHPLRQHRRRFRRRPRPGRRWLQPGTTARRADAEATAVPVAAPPARARPARPALPRLLRQRVFRRYWSAQTVSLLRRRDLHAGPAAAGRAGLRGVARRDGLPDRRRTRPEPALLAARPAPGWTGTRTAPTHDPPPTSAGRCCSRRAGGVRAGRADACRSSTWSPSRLGTLAVIFEVRPAALFACRGAARRLRPGEHPHQRQPGDVPRGRAGLGGLLVQFLTAPVALLADALSYLGSAHFLVSRIRPTRAARRTRRAWRSAPGCGSWPAPDAAAPIVLGTDGQPVQLHVHRAVRPLRHAPSWASPPACWAPCWGGRGGRPDRRGADRPAGPRFGVGPRCWLGLIALPRPAAARSAGRRTPAAGGRDAVRGRVPLRRWG